MKGVGIIIFLIPKSCCSASEVTHARVIARSQIAYRYQISFWLKKSNIRTFEYGANAVFRSLFLVPKTTKKLVEECFQVARRLARVSKTSDIPCDPPITKTFVLVRSTTQMSNVCLR